MHKVFNAKWNPVIAWIQIQKHAEWPLQRWMCSYATLDRCACGGYLTQGTCWQGASYHGKWTICNVTKQGIHAGLKHSRFSQIFQSNISCIYIYQPFLHPFVWPMYLSSVSVHCLFFRYWASPRSSCSSNWP